MLSRRRLIGTGAVATLAVPGCLGLLEPDPVVHDSEWDADVFDSFSGTATVDVLVGNDGRSGDIDVGIEIFDDEGTRIEREVERIELAADGQRTVSIDVSVPEEAESYRADTSAA